MINPSTIDPIVCNTIQNAAKNQNTSASRWFESFAFDSLKTMGLIDSSQEKLGEVRGGDRKSKNYQQEK
ncbi:MAG: hypothetical protein ACR2LR_06020 [Hassallia sp.]